MNDNNTTSAKSTRFYNATKLENVFRLLLEIDSIDIYNLVETYWSPEYDQFRAWDRW